MKDNPNKEDLKKFKFSLLILPIIPSIIFYFKHHETVAIYLIAIFWCLLLIALIPKLDKFVYKFCKKFLSILGALIAGIALVFTWVFAIFPTALLAKVMKRDRLMLEKTDVDSYWKEAKPAEQTYENQY